MIKTLITALISLLLSSGLTGQAFEWVHEPFIEGYDTVEIKRQNLDFILVTKNGKIGVVTLKNELIIPTEFSEFTYINKDYIVLRGDRGSSYFNKEGQELDYINEIVPLTNARVEKNRIKNAQDVLKELQNIWPGVKTSTPESKDGDWPLIKANGDTLLVVTNLDESQVIEDKFFYYTTNARETYTLVDKNLKRIIESKRKSVQVLDNGHVEVSKRIVNNKGQEKINKYIVDSIGGLNLGGYSYLSFGRSSRKYFAKKKDTTDIFNEDFTPFLKEHFDRVESHRIGEDIYFTLFSEGEMSFLNLRTGYRDRHSYHLKKISGGESPLRSFMVDSLIGLYNIAERKVIIKPKYL